MDKIFRSIYAHHIKDLIDLKRNLGFKYNSAYYYLFKIDELAFENNEIGPGITKNFADRWMNLRPNESSKSKYLRVSHLASFCAFIADLGIETYIPALPKKEVSSFAPFIFSEDEIHRLFEISNNLRYKKNGHNMNLFAFPLLLRFLYSTGLRIGEAISLLEDDVNLETKTIRTTDSKNEKQRIIPISDTLALQFSKYFYYKKNLPTPKHGGPNYLFVGTLRKKISKARFYYYFNECITILKMQPKGLIGFPRIHDLRHTFAVTSLTNMTNEGVNPNSSLPILSTYLGHSNLSSTEIYIRLTNKMYPNIIQNLKSNLIDVLPDQV